MSFEQGLSLTGVSRGRPGRRPGDERSHAPDYCFIIYKINPISSGFEDSSVPGFLDPDGYRNHLFSSRSFVLRNIYFRDTFSSSNHCATSKTLLGFGVLGCCLGEGLLLLLVRVVSAVYDCVPSLSPALRSLHGRPGWSGSNRSTDLLPLSPSLSLPRR